MTTDAVRGDEEPHGRDRNVKVRRDDRQEADRQVFRGHEAKGAGAERDHSCEGGTGVVLVQDFRGGRASNVRPSVVWPVPTTPPGLVVL